MTRFDAASFVGAVLPSGGRDLVIVQLLASGGIAHVFLARSASGAERVAVKLLRPEMESKAEVVARFSREALAASRIRHENVIRVFEPVQRSSGLAYFACEFLSGVDLADLLAPKARLSPGRALRIAIGAARGLGAAHAAGVVHRDVKPENLFLVHQDDGRESVRVLDFGSAWLDAGEAAPPKPARLTAATSRVGTPGYMAPEQAEGDPGHATADVYSLGVVLYEALAARAPFSGRTWVEILHKHATAPLPPVSGASSELGQVLEKMLAKDPAARFQSMADVESALALVPEALTG
jgi:serine/threonine-protein kinase